MTNTDPRGLSATFSVPEGWTEQPKRSLVELIAPEADLRLVFVEPGPAVDARSAVAAAWKAYRGEETHGTSSFAADSRMNSSSGAVRVRAQAFTSEVASRRDDNGAVMIAPIDPQIRGWFEFVVGATHGRQTLTVSWGQQVYEFVAAD